MSTREAAEEGPKRLRTDETETSEDALACKRVRTGVTLQQVRGDANCDAATVDLYMCRHGTTTWNLATRWQGETDTELAEQGIEQAKATAAMLAERLPGVRCILTSDLKRARATAEIYASQFGCQVIVDRDLREPSLGSFEGMTKDRIYGDHSDLFTRLSKLPQQERLRTAYFEGLETPLETSQRAEMAASRAAEVAFKDHPGVVLLVTHSKVLEAVLAAVFGKYYEGVATKPCAFFHWKYSTDGKHELGEMHDIKFHDALIEQ